MERHVKEMRSGAPLRGVEATIERELVREGDRLLRRLPGTGETVTLGPLKRTIRYHLEKQRLRPIPREERAAFDSLRRAAEKKRGTSSLLSVAVEGVLSMPPANAIASPPLLEVRR